MMLKINEHPIYNTDKKIFKILPIGVYVDKFNLSVKRSRLNEDYKFFLTLFGPCPKCWIQRPRANSPLILEKKIFKGFLVLFVHLFDLRLFGFVCFLFLLVSRKCCIL